MDPYVYPKHPSYEGTVANFEHHYYWSTLHSSEGNMSVPPEPLTYYGSYNPGGSHPIFGYRPCLSLTLLASGIHFNNCIKIGGHFSDIVLRVEITYLLPKFSHLFNSGFKFLWKSKFLIVVIWTWVRWRNVISDQNFIELCNFIVFLVTFRLSSFHKAPVPNFCEGQNFVESYSVPHYGTRHLATWAKFSNNWYPIFEEDAGIVAAAQATGETRMRSRATKRDVT